MAAIIVGAGIGGLTAALALHAAGHQGLLFEEVHEPPELGVGIILLPAAVQALELLGLLNAIEPAGIRISSLVVASKSGQEIGLRSRRLSGGLDAPLISISRSKLLGILLNSVRERLGPDSLRTGCRLEGITQTRSAVTARFRDRSTNERFERTAPCLIGADGINSTTRSLLVPRRCSPSWSGYMFWGGAVECPVWNDGRAMFIGTEKNARLVFYPVSCDPSKPDLLVANWTVTMHVGDGDFAQQGRVDAEDWTRAASRSEVEDLLGGKLQFGQLDLRALVRHTKHIFEYPVLDRYPVDRWTRGRVTLLGSAADPSSRNRANSATRAILDACCLSKWFKHSSHYAALRGYEAERRSAPANELVKTSRRTGAAGHASFC